MLCTAIGDSTLSVRVSAASAAANVADALQQQQRRLDRQMTAPLLELATGTQGPVHTSVRGPYVSQCTSQAQKCQGTCTRHVYCSIVGHAEHRRGLRGCTYILPNWVSASGLIN